jgi:SAM-dependent methyltransferase
VVSKINRERRLEQVYGARSNDELRALYDAWAGRYDQDLQAFGYSYPPPIAGLVGRYVLDRDAPILDAGAGTGSVGEVLAILSYTRITGIDFSAACSRSHGPRACTPTLCAPLDFADDAFVAVVSAGVLTMRHAPPSGFDELIRVTPPGCHPIFTLNLPGSEVGGFKGRWRSVEIKPTWCSFAAGAVARLGADTRLRLRGAVGRARP